MKLQGTISPDGKITFGQKPKPRLDIIVALPSNPIDGLAEVIREFISNTLPQDFSVLACSEIPEDPFKVGIIADRTDVPPNCKPIDSFGYVRNDGSCILMCGIMTEHAGGDITLLRRRLERGYQACLDIIGKSKQGLEL